jgi:hypothetical protein
MRLGVNMMTDSDLLKRIHDTELAERPGPGTGKLAGEKKFRMIHISMAPDLADTLARLGVNKSQLIEKLLRFYLSLLDASE